MGRRHQSGPDNALYVTQWSKRMITRVEVARSGIGLGAALAVTISWSANHSILWAILHGIFSWFYVIYYAMTR